MSRFFVQFLLSMAIGVSAAMGLGPQAIKIRQDAKASLHQRVNIGPPTASNVTTQVKTSTSVSAQTQNKSSIKLNAKTDAKVKGGLDTQVNTNTGTNTNIGGTALNDLLPQTSPGGSVDSSVTVNTQTNASVNTPVVDLKLKNTIKSDLDLNLLP
jgi:hypothetical protein